jgi:hypothetical protein
MLASYVDRMKRVYALVIAFSVLAASAAVARAAAPVVFSPIPVRAGEYQQDVTEMPDGLTMFVTIASLRGSTIVEFHRPDSSAAWKLAGPAAFSGKWRDLEEVLTPDGRAMIFASNRPLPGSTKALDAFYGGKYRANMGGNLWIVRRTSDGWGTPEPLPAAINANTAVFSPAVAADGTLYFMRATGGRGLFHLFVSKPPYRTAMPAPFASASAAEFDPTVSPDGSTVVFSSTRSPLPKHVSHLFVTQRTGTGWTTPRDLGPAINITRSNVEARLLAGHRLCYNSSGVLYCTEITTLPMRS